MDSLRAAVGATQVSADISPFDHVVPRKPPPTEKEQKKKKEKEMKIAKKKPASKRKLQSDPESDPRYKK